MPKVGGRRVRQSTQKKTRTAKEAPDEGPRIWVIQSGEASREMRDAVLDLRKCVYPNTALKLECHPRVPLEKCLSSARAFEITNLLVLERVGESGWRDAGHWLKVINVKSAETMTFRIVNYRSMGQVLKAGGEPFNLAFKTVLMVVTNFDLSGRTRAIARSLQQLFPPLQLASLEVEHIKRVATFAFSPRSKAIYFRHYRLRFEDPTSPCLVGASQAMSEFNSLSEYFQSMRAEAGSRSGEHKVRLAEIGPRLRLKFEAFSQGQVLEDSVEEATSSEASRAILAKEESPGQ